ncbi:MAG: glutamine-hydrolyzing carbamoyl-phosphate synthase small subunit [Bacillota bacterium]|nr:glutamine-hydrolyzing carbamoyl-phosphate synthase small subunit [Bacillota bacterium]
MRALMVLEDGFSLEGRAFAGSGEAYGEVVFNTSMAGYQEIITDPSYKGQIVSFTYPLIGNYGVNEHDVESERPQVEALIVREYSRVPSNWRSTRTLRDYLEANGVLGIEEVDTRALTRHVREVGAMRGVISTTDLDRESLLRKVLSHPGLVGRDMVSRVTCAREYTWNTSGRYRVVAVDFGIKRSILRMLDGAGCQVTVVPAYTPAEEILAKDPDGIFLSNGPGDPAGVPVVAREVEKLVGQKPIFGICLGHQILGLALGLSTFKLKYGHRGANHPVKNLVTGKVEITSQNHGFCVQAALSSIHEMPLAAAAASGAVPGMPGVPGVPAVPGSSRWSGAPGPGTPVWGASAWRAATAGRVGTAWRAATAGCATTAGPTSTAGRTGTTDDGAGAAGAAGLGASRGSAGRAAAPPSDVNQMVSQLERTQAAIRITHVNLNDGTLEGMEVPELLCFSVQYHPEASPGPHDSRYLFGKFISMMEGNRGGGGHQVASPTVRWGAARTAIGRTTSEAMGRRTSGAVCTVCHARPGVTHA